MIELHPTLKKVASTSEIAYRSMIQTYLARLLDIDSEFNFDINLSNKNGDNDHHHHHNDKTSKNETFSIFGQPLTHEGICIMAQLIEYISRSDRIIEEGIFRKSGVRSRQQQLKTMLSSGQTIDIDYESYTVHDCCDLLKRFVNELPQSLLTTDEMQRFFLRSLHLDSEQKKLDTIRLLILLLPITNQCFLHELLSLFINISKYSDQNRMSIKNIAAIFSPSIFRCQWSSIPSSSSTSSNSSSSSSKSNSSSSSMNNSNVQNMLLVNQESIKCLSYMIYNVHLIFEPPEQLLVDATLYLSNHLRLKTKQQQQQNLAPNSNIAAANIANNLISVSNLSAIPATKFCVTNEQSYSAKDYTERQLAELYAQMQSMASESPSMQKKLKKLNHNNNNGTPKLKRDKQQQEIIRQTLKKSASLKKSEPKGLKSLFKRIMTPNSERKSCKPSLTPNTPVTKITYGSSFKDDSKKSASIEPPKTKTSLSPRSIVPIDEALILSGETPSPKTTTISPKCKQISTAKLIRRQSSRTFHETKVPIAIVTPNIVDSADRSQCKKRSQEQMRSTLRPYNSNSVLSSSKLSDSCLSAAKQKLRTINEKENRLSGQSMSQPAKIRSLPTPICKQNSKTNNNNNDDQVQPKRVKYLASIYEELIASTNDSQPSQLYRSSRIPIINRSLLLQTNRDDDHVINCNNDVDDDNQCEYVSLTSISARKKLSNTCQCQSVKSVQKNRHHRTSNSMRVVSTNTNKQTKL